MPIHKVPATTRAPYDSPTGASDPVPQKIGKVGMIILLIVAILALAGCAWMFIKYQNARKQINALTTAQGQQELAKKEAQTLLNKLGKLIVLPTGEDPTIATITDVDSLKAEQQFYQDAKNGDKVVIYVKAKKAIIFDEAKNIIVNVGPIFVNDTSTARTSSDVVN